MALQRAEDAELENKDRKVLLRLGDEAKALIDEMARRSGRGTGPYIRQAAVKQALADRAALGIIDAPDTGAGAEGV